MYQKSLEEEEEKKTELSMMACMFMWYPKKDQPTKRKKNEFKQDVRIFFSFLVVESQKQNKKLFFTQNLEMKTRKKTYFIAYSL